MQNSHNDYPTAQRQVAPKKIFLFVFSYFNPWNNILSDIKACSYSLRIVSWSYMILFTSFIHCFSMQMQSWNHPLPHLAHCAMLSVMHNNLLYTWTWSDVSFNNGLCELLSSSALDTECLQNLQISKRYFHQLLDQYNFAFLNLITISSFFYQILFIDLQMNGTRVNFLILFWQK